MPLHTIEGFEPNYFFIRSTDVNYLPLWNPTITWIILFIVNTPFLTYGGNWDWKSWKGSSIFSCINWGRGTPYDPNGELGNKRVVQHWFSLVMWRFCSDNALYSASLSFTMFVFLLTSFDTWDYFFQSNLSLILKSLAYKKNM